jgi:hypothetical protein
MPSSLTTAALATMRADTHAFVLAGNRCKYQHNTHADVPDVQGQGPTRQHTAGSPEKTGACVSALGVMPSSL